MRALSAMIMLLLATTSALAGDGKGGGWITGQVGVVGGSVEYDCISAPSGQCNESGLFYTTGGALTIGGNTLLRFRGMVAAEQTEERPQLRSLAIGRRLGDSGNWALFLGGSRVLHADDNYDGNADGVGLEMIYAGHSKNPMGFELSFYWHQSADVSAGGLNLGLRFGALD